MINHIEYPRMADSDFLPRQHVEDIESLYELVCETEIEFQKFKTVVEELEASNYLEVLVDNEDKVLYKAKPTLKWHSDICNLSDPIKKKILLCLIDNPKSFFVLFNTQKGKLRIAGKEMYSWSKDTTKKMVGILIVDNDRTLSEQSVNGLFDCFEKVDNHESIAEYKDKFKVKIFELSSNNKISLTTIITHIDAYAHDDDYYMPLIVALANNKQIEKIIKILHHIYIKKQRKSALSAGIVWDEADKTYPLFRNKTFKIAGEEYSYLDFYNQEDTISRAGFVTATDGPLLEEEYDECANAYHHKVRLDPEDEKNYIAFHSEESEKKYINMKSFKEPKSKKDAKETKEADDADNYIKAKSNNKIAIDIITKNWEEHFKKPVTLKDGSTYYRKTIINSNPKGDHMKALAMDLVKKGAHAITFNQFGVTLFTRDGPADGNKFSTRKQNFNKVLFFIYKKYNLNSAPLFILGRRKVDRGLGFHYAPRKTGTPVKSITMKVKGKDETIVTDGIEGLIWTDLILGNKIEDLASAVQKAGRGAGIIRQCPQFHGKFTYWVETETADRIEHHYKKVDKTNNLEGASTMLQAMTRADAEVSKTIRNHDVDNKTYKVIKGTNNAHTFELVKKIIKDILKASYIPAKQYSANPAFYQTSLNTDATVVQLLDVIKKVPGAYGTNKVGEQKITVYRRFLPCYSNTNDPNSLYCVIPLIDPAYTKEQKEKLEKDYAEYLVDIPQTGSLEHL